MDEVLGTHSELTDHQAWPARAAGRRAIVDYIGWYNGTRPHGGLGLDTAAGVHYGRAKAVRAGRGQDRGLIAR